MDGNKGYWNALACIILSAYCIQSGCPKRIYGPAEERQTTKSVAIESCMAVVTTPGNFLLMAYPRQDDDDKSDVQHAARFCSLKIRSAPNKKIKITVTNGRWCHGEDDRRIKVMGGWVLSEQSRRRLWPDTADTQAICLQGRAHEQQQHPPHFEVERNVAEIEHWLSPSEYVALRVQFVDNDSPCDLLLTNADIGRNVTMIQSPDDAGERRCCIRMPGQIDLTVHTDIDNPDCASEKSTVDVETGASLWRLTSGVTYCEPGTETVLLPCKHVEANVHFMATNARQVVQFQFRPADQLRAMLYEKMCF